MCDGSCQLENAFHIVIIHVYSGHYIDVVNRMVQTIPYYNLIKFPCLLLCVASSVYSGVYRVVFVFRGGFRYIVAEKWSKVQIMHVAVDDVACEVAVQPTLTVFSD